MKQMRKRTSGCDKADEGFFMLLYSNVSYIVDHI